MRDILPAETERAAFAAFIAEQGYPCMLAKSTLKREQFTLGCYADFGRASDALAADLARFARAPEPKRGFRSFVAVFDGEAPASEAAFERALWATLRALHARDTRPWDPAVSADPADPTFSFSFAERAFYVIGMHPHASRPGRRYHKPALVFNLHAQFERLRAEGRYDRVRSLIRDRDRAFAGSVNPMLDDFGARSEARQYAGRAVGRDWACPFRATPDPSPPARCPFSNRSSATASRRPAGPPSASAGASASA